MGESLGQPEVEKSLCFPILNMLNQFEWIRDKFCLESPHMEASIILPGKLYELSDPVRGVEDGLLQLSS